MSQRSIAVYFIVALATALLCVLPLALLFLRLNAESGGRALEFLPFSILLPRFLLPALSPLLVAAFLFAYFRRQKAAPPGRLRDWAWIVVLFAGAAMLDRAQFLYVKLAVLLLFAAISLHLLSGRLPAGPWFRRCAGLLTFVLFLLLLAEPVLIVVELGLLRSGFSAADSRLKDYGDLFQDGFGPGGGLAPNLNLTMKDGYGRPIAARTNAHGFRTDHELKLPKPQDELRIILLGDSFSVGYRIDQERMISSVLERSLAERERSVRVFPAHTLDQYEALQWMRRYGNKNAFDADVIVIGICEANDVHGSYFHARAAPSPALRRQSEAVLASSMLPAHAYEKSESDYVSDYGRRLRLLDLALRIYGNRITPMPYDNGRPGALRFWEHGLGLYLRETDATVNQVWDAYAKTLVKIQAAAPGDVPVVFAIFPMRFQISDAEWEVTRRYWWLRDAAFDPLLVNRKIGSICKQNDLHCVDLLPEFRARADDGLYYPNDFHWNNAGNAVAGEALARRLNAVLD